MLQHQKHIGFVFETVTFDSQAEVTPIAKPDAL